MQPSSTQLEAVPLVLILEIHSGMMEINGIRAAMEQAGQKFTISLRTWRIRILAGHGQAKHPITGPSLRAWTILTSTRMLSTLHQVPILTFIP